MKRYRLHQRGIDHMRTTPVRALQTSCDRKLSPVSQVKNSTSRLRPEPRAPFCSSTYVSIEATCPDTCSFKGEGCYASAGFTGGSLRKMDRVAAEGGFTGDIVIAIEAAWIDAMFVDGVPQDGARGGRDLRLHVGGDVSSTRGARMLAGAAKRWRARGGGTVWTYTHRWRTIPRSAWGTISVLASVESEADARDAVARGYAPALVVESFEQEAAYPIADGLKVVPCPAQTRGTTCVECRLCLDRDLHALGIVIGFELHGKAMASAKRRLPVLPARAA